MRSIHRFTSVTSTSLFVLSSFLSVALTHADLLPYVQRNRAYNGMSSTIWGDIRTVGMSGAGVGLADTFISSLENPAGLAMTLRGGDDNFSTNLIYDRHIQNYDEPLRIKGLGVALSDYPWGYSLGYHTPYEEGQLYDIVGYAGSPSEVTLSIKEFRLSIARLIADGKISLGASLKITDANLSLEPRNKAFPGYTNHETQLGFSLGSSIHLGDQYILGISFSPEMNFKGDSSGNPSNQYGISQFLKPVLIPWKTSFALARIPNRFFRWDFSLSFIGKTDNAGLIRDENILVGQEFTYQPKLGMAYVFGDFKEFKSTLFLGSYYEKTRIQNTNDRIHVTGGIEAKAWVMNFGVGMDIGSGYRNYLIGIGVDVFKVMSKLDLIPLPWQGAQGGWFPSPFHVSDEALARPLVKNWKATGQEIDPLKVGLELPGKIEKKIEEVTEDIKQSFKKKNPPKKKK